MPYDEQRAPDRRATDTAQTPHGEADPRAPKQRETAAAPPAQDRRAPPPERPRRRRPLLWLLLALAVLALAIGGVWYWYTTRNEEATDDAYTDGNAVTIAPQISGQVVQLAVNDNQHVKAGDVLIRIDPRPFAAARDQAQGTLAAAEGQMAAAQYAVELAKSTFPARLASAKAQRDAAAAVLAKAEADLRRQRSLPRSATTQQDVDQATAAERSAVAQLAQAEAGVTEATPVQPNISQISSQFKQLQGVVAQARAQVEQAELNLSYAVVTAPVEGFVTKRNVDQGNYVTAGSAILSLVTPQVWVTANFKETELNRMRAGQAVRIAVDAYPGLKLRGHVDSVQMGSGSKFTAFPPENATGNFVKIVQRVPVKIDIDSGLDPDLPLPLGISVEPTVTLN